MYVSDHIKKTLENFASEDCVIAIRAGHKMADHLQEDVAILRNLEVVKLSEARETPLEIIRFQRRVTSE